MVCVYFTPHDLRRWVATALKQAGVGVYTIKGVLNHRSGCRLKLGSIQTESGKTVELEGGIVGTDPTMRYVQISLAMKRWALEKLEAILLGKHHDGSSPTLAMPRLTRQKNSFHALTLSRIRRANRGNRYARSADCLHSAYMERAGDDWSVISYCLLAPRVGIEPTTNGLTVRRSTAELPGNTMGYEGGEFSVSPPR